MRAAADQRIRAAALQEAPALAALLRHSITELCQSDHKGDADLLAAWLKNKTPETLSTWIAAPDLRVRVLESEGTLLGLAMARLDGEILLNYVHPMARFMGVSSALLSDVEALLAAKGLTRAHLSSTRTAHRFYLSRGWEDAGPAEMGFGTESFPMQKALSGSAEGLNVDDR